MRIPISLNIVKWIMNIKLAISIFVIILYLLFFISGGGIWESFKQGALETSLGINASEYSSYYFGQLLGKMIFPLLLIVLSVQSIKRKRFKTLITSIIIQILLSLVNVNILYLLVLIVALILTFSKSSRDYFKKG